MENRPWRTRHRGPLAIHASKKIDPAGLELAASLGIDVPAHTKHTKAVADDLWLYDPAHWLVTGGVIGTVELVDCLTVEQWEAQNDWLPDPFAVGPWCHVYAHPTPLDRPVPAKGQQRLWSIAPRKLETQPA